MLPYINTNTRLWLITLNEWLRVLDYCHDKIKELEKDLAPLLRIKANKLFYRKTTYFQQQLNLHHEAITKLKQGIEKDQDHLRNGHNQYPDNINYEYMKRSSELIRHEEEKLNTLKLRYDQFRIHNL